MNILHISATDNAGGSGRSAYRIHNELRRRGHGSKMLVNYRVTDDPDVGYLWRSFGWRAADAIVRRVTERLSLQYLYYPSSYGLQWHPWFREADVVQLYNTHGGYFSHTALPLLSAKKPVIWRLSDQWPMTGHCAYSFECDRWKTGCGQCPHLFDAPALRVDRTAQLWLVKQRVFAQSQLEIVAPSSWMAGFAKASPLLSRFPLHVIPNGLDATTFRPVPRDEARRQFGIAQDARVALFVSLEIDAVRKGGAYFKAAAAKLAAAGGAPFEVLAVGAGADAWRGQLPVRVTAVDAMHDDARLAAAYSAADVYVMPTMAENLPNAVLESMACGTPVVAFATGGVVDAVRPGETGWLARVGDADDLAAQMGEALVASERNTAMRMTCRRVVEVEYTSERQAEQFEQLYARVIEERRRAA